ncbi:antitoxin Xre/MbcA/ParS toxin-binding domain-containing protein [Hoeflea sp. BAL378]|uniref:type II RES/Xre toxin-antitoxin system antitoxin n=1 Tax=Hoeflea sp. BAL378 TaxID=1547437 RepID=UPI001FCB470D|nr:antitoxin Xre/MbcA/ParS toxin-binding domain-containing protein [Hoeflea sp. BAL378]
MAEQKSGDKAADGGFILMSDGSGMEIFTSLGKMSRDTGAITVRAETAVINSLKSSGFTLPEITRLVVSKRSLERRQQNREPLSATESDRALRLSRIHDHAVRVFGSAEKANRWLRKPSRALDGVVPLDLLASETGAHIVDSELHAIDHGMFA